ncbi:hypothetical protein F511_11133 [Dorcoceras hygrometricum]|uniref:Uncharacterized protein n=1 Tax=Dorcoceras hygrometricum TaxID=472368 RepID=A0A2Z7A3Q1_9LAMI|nr:hypothetical protein F511_11133 [Dorcoceras hygrometricum]
MMNSRRICPADGSQYKVSAVGLVFIESAAGLAMETSEVESAVRNQAEAKMNQLEHIAIQEAKKSRKMELEQRRSAGSYCHNQQLRRCARYGISCDDISLDVITISSWLSADEEKRNKMKRRRASVDNVIADIIIFSRWFERAVARYQQIQQMLFALKIKQSQDTSWKHMFNTSWTTRRKQQQHPVVSYNEPAVAIYPVASFSAIAFPVDLLNDKKPAKEKDASTIPCRFFTRHISNGKMLCPTGRNLNRGLYTSRAPLKKQTRRGWCRCEAVAENKLIAQCTSRGKNEKKDEAIDRH